MPARRRFALLCAATFFHFVAMGMFVSGLPLFVTNVLEGSKAAVGLVVGAFSVSAVVSRPWVGRRVDRAGRSLFLRGAPTLIALTAGSLLLVGSVVGAVAVRLVQGIGGSAYYTAAATAATDLSPADRRADYISRFSLFLYGGFAIGPALSEGLIGWRGYSWAWMTAAASSLVAAGILLALPETGPARAPQARRRRLFHPAALGPGAVLLTVAVGYTAIQAFTPLYARRIGLGSSGGLYATFAVTILLVRLVSGRLADRHGRVTIAAPGLVCGVAGMLLLAGVARPLAAFAGVALFGACHALIFPALMALTVDRVSDDERGEVLGSFTACFDVGAAIGGYAIGWIADVAGFRAAWSAPALLCGAGLVILLAVGQREARAVARTHADEAPPLEPAGT